MFRPSGPNASTQQARDFCEAAGLKNLDDKNHATCTEPRGSARDAILCGSAGVEVVGGGEKTEAACWLGENLSEHALTWVVVRTTR